MNRLLFASLTLALLACGGGTKPSLAPLAPVTGNVNETLVVDLVVENGSEGLSFDFDGPDLPALRATVSGGGGGGTFRWTPLASHVGTHEFTVHLRRGGTTLDSEPLIVTVNPAEDAAPVFIRPGAGGTFDLSREPCVRFDIEVRDDDSADVLIAERGSLPEGALVVQDGPKSGRFEWCPTPDQVAAAERWTIPLQADDREHPPTELDYIAVLRTDAKPGCPGTAPVISVTSPSDGTRVTSGVGYEVRVTVSDDMGLRDAPLLFYTTSAPDDPSTPDVTTFEQLVFAPSGGEWLARIPPLGLDDGEEQQVWFVVSATDNDDPGGATCDHRSDSPLRSFIAVGGSGGVALGDCEPCSASSQCSSGICANAASGARCVPGCSGTGMCATGTCGATATVEGSVRAGCGPVAEVCGGGGACVDDGREDDDTPATATPYTAPIADGQICAGDPDYFRLGVSAGTRVSATLDNFVHSEGDLDLQMLDGRGGILDTSAGATNAEFVEYCFPADGTAIVRVEGYGGAENAYDLRIETAADPAMCCTDDDFENNDDRASARPLPFEGNTADFVGTICPRDDDWYRFEVGGPTNVSITLLIETAGQDLDVELRGPTDSIVAASRGTTNEENIEARVSEPGTYAIRVLGFLDASSAYLGEVSLTLDTGCTSSRDCPLEQVCGDGRCIDRSCSGATCPTGHICPDAGLSPTPSECGQDCSSNSDCRSGEACKWFWEGRYCGLRGGGANGARCTDFTDCGGQRACVPWPMGSCARAGCASSSDCETGTYCVDSGEGYNICAVSCVTGGDSDCRTSDGYECSFVNEIGRDPGSRFVCVPAS